MNKNANQLKSFTDYCAAHPDERFWQALRNWSEYTFIFGSCADSFDDLTKLHDTFYKEDEAGPTVPTPPPTTEGSGQAAQMLLSLAVDAWDRDWNNLPEGEKIFFQAVGNLLATEREKVRREMAKKLLDRCIYNQHNLGELGDFVKIDYLKNFINDLLTTPQKGGGE